MQARSQHAPCTAGVRRASSAWRPVGLPSPGAGASCRSPARFSDSFRGGSSSQNGTCQRRHCGSGDCGNRNSVTHAPRKSTRKALRSLSLASYRRHAASMAMLVLPSPGPPQMMAMLSRPQAARDPAPDAPISGRHQLVRLGGPHWRRLLLYQRVSPSGWIARLGNDQGHFTAPGRH